MPVESLIFVAGVVIAFTGFALVLAWVDASTKATRRRNHPLPGE